MRFFISVLCSTWCMGIKMPQNNDSVNQGLYKSNYRLMMTESSLFWLASAFIDANIVVSIFIYEFTGSMQLAGLSSVIRTASFLTAHFIAGFLLLGVAKRVKIMHRIAIATRCTILLMVPTLLIGVPNNVAAVILIICLAVFYTGDGFIGLIWMGISARTIPHNMRGQMIGNAQVIAGSLSLAAGFVIKTIMGGDLPSHIKYSLIFGLGGLFFLFNMIILNQIKDSEEPYHTPESTNMKVYLGQFKHILFEMPRPRLVIISRAVYTLTLMAAPLTILFGQSHLSLPKEVTSSMVYIQIAGVLCGGFFWGRLSRFFSTGVVMIGSMSMAILIGSFGVAAYLIGAGTIAQYIFFAMVFFVGFNQSSWLGFSNELIRISNEENRTTMFVLMAIIQIPASFGPYIAGIMAEKISFLPVFITVLLFGAAGVLMTLELFRSRKTGREQ